MSKVLVIGAGGVGSVAVHKMAMNPEIFPDITLASRRKFKCDAIAESVHAMVRAVQEYVPGYRLLQEPQVDEPSAATRVGERMAMEAAR